ncbi:hypothetical protein WDV85_09620 [Pseudokineococcus sp. 5B2Z-1]|uniref:hypothetical protein n=1 Tax=Pseudokineococcus sp. 5B2Z-1 TaxID=3132744 RepID=UPI003095D9D9
MRSEDTEMPPPAGRGHLAATIAVGLALFLGGSRVVDLAGATNEDRYLLAVVASLLIRYAGAFTVALFSFALVRRVLAHRSARRGAETTSPALRPRRREAAFVLILVGLALMVVWEVRLPVLLYQVRAGNYSGFVVDGTSDVVLQVLLIVSGYLGPVMTAVGAYLLLRRLEVVAAGEPLGTAPASGEVVTDLDD